MEKTLAIQSMAGEHLGFLLFSGSPQAGDCIFQILPQRTKVFDKQDFKFIEQFGFRMAGEHKWKVENGKVFIAFSTNDTATIDLSQDLLTFNSGPEFRVRKPQTNK